MAQSPPASPRLAGWLYLLIIACGLWAEGFVRGTLVLPEDAGATARNLLAAAPLFRMGIMADMVMALADVGVGVILFRLLMPFGQGLALAALAMRLVQAAVIASALPALDSAVTLAASDPDRALAAIRSHGFSYDIGLMFFGLCCLLTGTLLWRGGVRILAGAVMLAGLVYLAGSTLRITAPAMVALFQPAYLICILSELAFALWLLLGRGPGRLRAAAEGGPGRA